MLDKIKRRIISFVLCASIILALSISFFVDYGGDLFSLDSLFSTESYVTFLGIVAGSFISLLVLFFSIVMIQVQHAAEKYGSHLIEDVKYNIFLNTAFLYFFFGIFAALVGITISDFSKIPLFIFVLLFCCVLIIYFSFRFLVDWINPTKIVERVKERIIHMALRQKDRDWDNLSQRIFALHMLLIKGLEQDQEIFLECLNSYSEIAERTAEKDCITASLAIGHLGNTLKSILGKGLFTFVKSIVYKLNHIINISHQFCSSLTSKLSNMILVTCRYIQEKSIFDRTSLEDILFLMINTTSVSVEDSPDILLTETPEELQTLIVVASLIARSIPKPEKILGSNFTLELRRLITDSGSSEPRDLLERIFSDTEFENEDFRTEIERLKTGWRNNILRAIE